MPHSGRGGTIVAIIDVTGGREDLASVEACARTRMARRSDLHDAKQQRITIAISCHTPHILPVARGVTLSPQFFTGSRPVGDPARRQCSVHGLPVHPRMHEYAEGLVVLHNNRDEPFRVELQMLGDPRVVFE